MKHGHLKEWLTKKIYISWKCTHPQAIQDVDEFVSSSEHIWRNVALHHLLIKTSHKSTSNPHHSSPVHQLMSYFNQKQRFEVKNFLMMVYFFFINSFSLFSMLIDGLDECGLLVDYRWCFYQLSFWRHPFTGEGPLMSKGCNANFSKSVPMKKQTHLHLGWHEGEYIFSKFSFLGELFTKIIISDWISKSKCIENVFWVYITFTFNLSLAIRKSSVVIFWFILPVSETALCCNR